MTKIRRHYRNLIEKCLGIKIEEEGISYMELVILLGLVVILFSVVFPLIQNIENKTTNLVQQTQRLQAALNNRSNVGVLRTISSGAGYTVDNTLVPTKLATIAAAGTGSNFEGCAQFHQVATNDWTIPTNFTSGTCPVMPNQDAVYQAGIVATAKAIALGSIQPANAYVFSSYLTLDGVVEGTFLFSAAGSVQAADMSPSATVSPGSSATPSGSVTASASITPTPSASETPSAPASETSSPTASISTSSTATATMTATPSSTTSASATPSSSEPTVSPSASASATSSPSQCCDYCESANGFTNNVCCTLMECPPHQNPPCYKCTVTDYNLSCSACDPGPSASPSPSTSPFSCSGVIECPESAPYCVGDQNGWNCCPTPDNNGWCILSSSDDACCNNRGTPALASPSTSVSASNTPSPSSSVSSSPNSSPSISTSPSASASSAASAGATSSPSQCCDFCESSGVFTNNVCCRYLATCPPEPLPCHYCETSEGNNLCTPCNPDPSATPSPNSSASSSPVAPSPSNSPAAPSSSPPPSGGGGEPN